MICYVELEIYVSCLYVSCFGHEHEHNIHIYICARMHSHIYNNNNFIFNYFISFINYFIYTFLDNKNNIHVYSTRTSLETKDNFTSALLTNKKTIGNAIMNLIESLILTRINVGGMFNTCKSDEKWYFQW